MKIRNLTLTFLISSNLFAFSLPPAPFSKIVHNTKYNYKDYSSKKRTLRKNLRDGKKYIDFMRGWNLIGSEFDNVIITKDMVRNSDINTILKLNANRENGWDYIDDTESNVDEVVLNITDGAWLLADKTGSIEINGTTSTNVLTLSIKKGWNIVSSIDNIDFRLYDIETNELFKYLKFIVKYNPNNQDGWDYIGKDGYYNLNNITFSAREGIYLESFEDIVININNFEKVSSLMINKDCTNFYDMNISDGWNVLGVSDKFDISILIESCRDKIVEVKWYGGFEYEYTNIFKMTNFGSQPSWKNNLWKGYPKDYKSLDDLICSSKNCIDLNIAGRGFWIKIKNEAQR